MTFDDYQREARKTAIYPPDKALTYLGLGIASEAGEVAGKLKKFIRDGDDDSAGLANELGDVLWYVAVIADEMDVDLRELAEWNLEKLRDRQERGQLQGSGDER